MYPKRVENTSQLDGGSRIHDIKVQLMTLQGLSIGNQAPIDQQDLCPVATCLLDLEAQVGIHPMGKIDGVFTRTSKPCSARRIPWKPMLPARR